MSNDQLENLLARLQPNAIQRCLMKAGLFLAGYELLKAEIQDKVKDFFIFPASGDEAIDTRDYDKHVKTLDNSEFRACCKWLHQAGAIDYAQLQEVFSIKELRNKIAHELPHFIIDQAYEIPRGTLEKMEIIIALLGQFWGRIHIETNPEYDFQEIEDHEIRSGPSLLMELIINACAEVRSPDTGLA